MIFFPKNAFEQAFSNTFERMLPTLQYIVWNPITRWARASGWTEQEKMGHNFFRGGNMMYHSYAQSIHPMAYLERSRADNYFRRVETILPGIQAPDWAQHQKRAVDFDFEGALNPYRAMNIVEQESTPKPHYGNAYPSSISHIGNYRYLLGYWAAKFFHNEVPRGTLGRGYYTPEHLEVLDSWYANCENNQQLRNKEKTQEELENMKHQAQKWIKNINQFFPEYANIEPQNLTTLIEEPYLERTVEEIANSIFLQKWVNSLENKTFSDKEVQDIYEFYVHNNDSVFWVVNDEDGLYHATPLYTKYVKAMGLPNVFDLNKYTARVVEQQYKDILTNNYNINLNTVEQFRRQHNKYVSELKQKDEVSAINHKRLRILITEEVYNPIYRKRLAEKAGDASGSYVVHLFNNHGVAALDELENLHKEIQQQLPFLNKEVHNNYLARIRNIVKTFPFKQAKTETKKF
jgi:hypothetical protein